MIRHLVVLAIASAWCNASEPVVKLLDQARVVEDSLTRDIPVTIDKDDGPLVAIKDPTVNMVKRPFDIAVTFTERGVPVDVASVKLLVKPLNGAFSIKFFDVTSRLRPYLTEKGFRIPNADIQAGRYAIVLIVRDQQGRESRGKIELTVLERSRWTDRDR